MRSTRYTGRCLACLLFLFFVIAPDTPAAPGRLNPDFGTGGKVTTDFGASDRCLATAPTPLGEKFLLVGYSGGNFALALYHPDGSLDSAFGSGGKVVTDFSGFDTATCAAVRPPGVAISDPAIIIVAGFSLNGSVYDFALARYDPVNGSLFSGFGTGGKVVTDFGGLDIAHDVAFQNDGKIVVAGYTNVNGSTNEDFALARYTTAGVLDSSFGSGGKLVSVLSGIDDRCNAIAITSDRRILAGGSSDRNFVIVRYLENGALDSSFGISGKSIVPFPGPGSSRCEAVIFLPGGKVLAAGEAFDAMVLARFNEDGSLDGTFGGGDGTVVLNETASLNSVTAITMQADGKFLVSGRIQPDENLDLYDMGIMRFKSDGSLDQTFGSGGRVSIDFGGVTELASGMLLRADGTISVGGLTDAGSTGDFAVASLETAQGDVRLGTRGTVPVGNDRYNLSGAGQQLSLAIRRGGGTKSAFTGVENDGASFDTFKIRGARGNSKFTVRYFAGRVNVTASMRAGRHTAELDSGSTVRLKTTLTAKTSRARQVVSIPIRSSSANDPGAGDLARIKARSN